MKPWRLLAPEAIDDLRDDLLAADYTLTGLQERLGETILAALGRNSSLPALRALGGAQDAQADAIRLFLLAQPVPAARLVGWASLPALVSAGLVLHATDGVRAGIEVKPHGSDRREGWICSDLTPLDGFVTRPRSDFVLGASPASTTLAQLVPPGSYASVLDLGTGCGIQALHLRASRIVATDLNPRALALAEISLGLSAVSADLRLGSLYEPVQDEQFDLILTNPPYVIAPPGGELVYREGGLPGDDLMRQVVTDSASHLREGGTLVVLGNWAHRGDQDWRERLRSWISPTGCDALVLQREHLDADAYIDLWLTDAGLLGTPDHALAYQRWADYFDALGITGVGLGWIVLRRSGVPLPEVRIEEWPHLVAQPVGAALGAHFDQLDLARSSDEQLLHTHLVCPDSVVQETHGRPGAPDPEHIVLRQTTGLCRAVKVDTATAAVVGACDGDLPLGVLLQATASVLEVEVSTLLTDTLPRLRSLITDGMLTGSHSVDTGLPLDPRPTLEGREKE